MIIFTQPKTVRISNSELNSSARAPLLIRFERAGGVGTNMSGAAGGAGSKTVQLKTLMSRFSDGHNVLESDSGDFLAHAQSLGFIRVSEGISVTAEETEYASGR